MTHPSRLGASAAVLLLTLSLFGAACGSDSDQADSPASPDEPAPCGEVYAEAGGAAEGPDGIDGRGEPEMQACTPDGSLETIDEVVGTGAEVPEGATVTVQYSGVDAPTGTVFDSSWSRGESISFGLDEVIPGWTQGMVGMKVGGRRTLVIPADLAYGDSGPAPGQSLVFTIDLVAVDSAAPATAPSSAPTTAAG